MTNRDPQELLQHADWLGRLARALTGSDADADDAVQEALARATTSGARPTGPARPWLAGILRNVVGGTARSRVASDRRERAAARPEARRSASDEVALLERQRLLLSHVEALPDAQRRTVLARYFDGRPPRAIAKEEGIATAAVHSRLRRALATLREQLDAEFGDRETWAAWIAPVAALGAEAPRSALVKVAAAALVLVAGIGAGAIALVPSTDGEADDVEEAAALRRSAQGARLAGEADGLQPIATDPDAPRRGTRSGTHTIAVVRADDGEPVTGVDVILVHQPSEDVASELFENPDMAEMLRRLGTRHAVDARGEVTLDAEPPAGVLVRAPGLFGAAEITEPRGRVVLEVEPTGGFLVTVVDGEGERVDRDVRVRYEVLVGDRTGPDDLNTYRYDLERLAEGGESLLQMPLGTRIGADGDEPLQEWLEWITIATPGAAESTEGAAVSIGLPFGESVATRPIRLVAPAEVGAIELVILDADGAPLGGEVSATLSFPGAPGPYDLTYEATAAAGRATWPEVVASGERVEIHVVHGSTGQRWDVAGRAPERDGETVSVETRAPAAEVITARLVDADGEPHSNDSASLAFAPNDDVRYPVALSGKTDAEGRVRFTVDESCQGRRASGVRVASRSFLRLEEGFALLDRREGDLDRGGDLGTITVEMRPRAKVEGVVLGPDGTPVPEAHVSISMAAAGHSRGTFSAADGSFSLEAVFGDVETLEVEDFDGRFAPYVTEVRPYELEDLLEIRLGATATVVARLDATGCPRAADMVDRSAGPGESLGVSLWPTDGGTWTEAELHLVDDGAAVEVIFENVRPGLYEARVGVHGKAPLAAVPGVLVPTGGGTYGVSGLDGLRLADLARYLEVVGTAEGEPVRVTSRIHAPEGDLLAESSSSVVLVPMRGSARAVFTSPGHRAITMEPGVPADRDRIELAFQPGLRASLTLLDPGGRLEPGTTLSLQLETGPAAGTWVHGGEVEAGAPVALTFPDRGLYRLHLQEPPERFASGRLSAAMGATELVVEVTGGGESLELQLPEG